MKLVKKVRLAFQEGKSDKVYEVDLVELPGNDDARYLVNFRYGRRGSALREGTKTARAVPLNEAERVFSSIVVSKTNAGYWDASGVAPPPRPVAPAPAKTIDTQARQSARIAALTEALTNEKDSRQRARLIWNLGNNEAAAQSLPQVIANLGRGEWIEDYSIAWTLGRWRDGSGLSSLEKLRRHANVHVASMAAESLLLTLTPAAAAAEIEGARAQLPQSLRTALDSRHEIRITDELRSLEAELSSALNQALATCYQIALVEAPVQRALLAYLDTCSFKPGVFKGLRHIFKTAEMRVDYDVFACLANRFDTTSSFFKHSYDFAYVPGQGSMRVSQELKRENSRLAYSNRTRGYLRKRAWRTLRRLGQADSPHYVALAAAALLRVTDGDAQAPRTREFHEYDEETGRRKRTVNREYDEYAHLTLFNHILRGADSSYRLGPTGTAWYRRGKARDGLRGESFAHLWDRAPAAALALLKLSRCSGVHDAAIRMLAGNTEFLHALSPAEVGQLLRSPYSQTVMFALPLAQALFDRGAGDDELLLALLRSSQGAARAYGAQQLTERPGWTAQPALMIELLLIFAPPVPGIVDQELARSPVPDGIQPEVMAGVITQLMNRDLALDVTSAENLARLLTVRLPKAVASVPTTLLERLLSHPEAGKQLLGARLLVASGMTFSEIPGRLLQHIHSSAHDEVRAVAIALLGMQTPAELLKQVGNLAELLHRGSALERRELWAVLDRLASQDAEAEALVLQAVIPLLFRSEREQGQGDELVAFFAKHQNRIAGTVDKNLIWRLLQAQAIAAQRVGALLLQSRAATEFTVRQWARLAQHSDASVRRFVMAAYAAHESEVKQNTRDALRIFDGKWDDAREFAFAYFRDRYRDVDWSPEFIIGICDSTVPQVQDFGRELLQRFFQQHQGVQYLAALSEHPSINVQLFVSGFLEQHAAGNRERILGLHGYFVTVLSQVNKARTTKDRVLEFLLRESLRDFEVARLAAGIFTRISLTAVRRDRGQLLTALIALQRAFPQLDLPVKAIPPRTRPNHTAAEVAGGV